MSTRKKNALLGFSADIGGMMLIQLLSLVLIPFYLKYISLEDYGYWLVIVSIMGWLGLADFGISFAVTRFFIKAMSEPEHEKENLNRVSNTSLFLFGIIAIVFLAAGFGLSPFFKIWFHINEKISRIFLIAFSISLAATTLMIPFALFSGLLEAKQSIALNRNIQTFGLVVQFLSSIFFIIVYKNIIGLAISILTGNIFTCILLAYFARKKNIIHFSRRYIDRSLLRQFFSFGGYFQLGRTANIIATNTDNLFIASFLDATQIPVYNFTSKLPLLFCNSIASKIASALFSGLSQVFDHGDDRLFKMTFEKLLSIISRIAFFSAILIFFINEKFVEIWVGKGSYGGFYLNLVFVYWVLFETIIRGTGIIFQIYGEMRLWALYSIVESLLNIALSFYFLFTGWGILGLALATSVARSFTIGIYWVWFVHKKQLILFRQLVKKMLDNLLRNLPMFGVLYLLSRFVHVDSPVFAIAIYSLVGLLINVLFYDWQILFIAVRKRSLTVMYKEYINKY